MPLTSRRISKLLPVLVLIVLALPASASAQATRTWVSGVGDDANPCSRTAPCKTFAGAISKTANGGEINCLDPGGFGGVTITKSLTIKCHYTEGGVLVSGTNAIVVNATATDKVTLRGLDINGIGAGAQTSLVGVKVLSAKTVQVVDSEVYRFKTGIANVSTANQRTNLVVVRSHIHDNGIGVVTAPGNNGASLLNHTTLRYNDISDNTCGVAAGSFGANGSTPDATLGFCGLAAAGAINRPTQVELVHNGINDNTEGVMTRGGSAFAELAYNDVTGNTAFGLHRTDGGHMRTFTPATNVITDNAASDAPDQNVPLTKRVAKRLRISH